MKQKCILFGTIVVLIIGTSLMVWRTSAAFVANHIIDNGIFDDSGSMNAAQIDAMLNTFSSSCISANKGFSSQDPTGYSPSTGFTYGGNVSAGTVIAHAAQAYDISPKVLIVTLQKEEGLIDGSYGCGPLEYAAAMGYGCPDSGTTHDYSGVNLYTINGNTVTSVSGTCVNTITNAGFTQQVIRGAWLLKFGEQRSQGNVGWAIVRGSWDNSDDPHSCYGGPMTQGTWQVCPGGPSTYYDGYRTIDSSIVHMDNGPTASLYWYTPHFHGNQLFVSVWEGWFGLTYAPAYSWRVESQESYADSARTESIDTDLLAPGQVVYMRLVARNIGNTTWVNSGPNPLRLGTSNPQDRTSVFCDMGSWISCNRATGIREPSVAPGQTGTFEFAMKSPSTYGDAREYFNLVSEGNAWLNDIGSYWSMSVRPPLPRWGASGQQLFADSARTNPVSSFILAPGTTYYASIQAKNTGNTTWVNSGPNPLRLGTSNPQDRISSFCNGAWVYCNRPATLKESSVAPGQTGNFELALTTPNTFGSYKEYLRPVAEGQTWLNDIGLYWPLNVKPPTADWQYLDQAIYTDNTKSTLANQDSAIGGSRLYESIHVRNIGNTTWVNSGPNPLLLGTSNPQDRASVFCDAGSWPSCNRTAVLKEVSVPQGQIGTFEFWVNIPYSPTGTSYNEYLRPVVEGQTWMPDLGLYIPFTTNTSATSWQYVDQSVFNDAAMTQPTDLANTSPSTTYYARLHIKNTSSQTWVNSGPNPLRLGTSGPLNRMSSFCNGSWLTCNRPVTLNESTIAPGQTGTFEFSLTTPSTPGSYKEYFRPIVEGQAWLDDMGQFWQFTVN